MFTSYMHNWRIKLPFIDHPMMGHEVARKNDQKLKKQKCIRVHDGLSKLTLLTFLQQKSRKTPSIKSFTEQKKKQLKAYVAQHNF